MVGVKGADLEGWVRGGGVVRVLGREELTAMSRNPSFAARCKEVLPLSVKSGFWMALGLLLTMRLTRTRSLRWIARRRRMETSIIGVLRGGEGPGGCLQD